MIGVLSLGGNQSDITAVITSDSGDVPMGATYCLSGPGPLAPGQNYCPGVLDTQATLSQQVLGTGMSSPSIANIPSWAFLLCGVTLFAVFAGGRRR